jgi:hypothetical protein
LHCPPLLRKSAMPDLPTKLSERNQPSGSSVPADAHRTV